MNETSKKTYTPETINPVPLSDKSGNVTGGKKKISILVDEDDPCVKREEVKSEQTIDTCAADPRFQEQDQSLRCWVMYSDFYRCQHILGSDSTACNWFKKVFMTICPIMWVERWDELRNTGQLSWHKYKTQGEFPGDKYGV